MKLLFRTIALIGALVLTPQALAQNNRQEDYLHIPIFNREKAVKQISYQDRGEHDLNYSPRINPDSSNELIDFIINTPLGTVYEISRDKKPVQLYDGRIKITWSASRGNSSVINGLVRRLVKFLKE